jgi:hypothetical protein
MEGVSKWRGSLRSNRFHDTGCSNYNADSMSVKAGLVHRLRRAYAASYDKVDNGV